MRTNELRIISLVSLLLVLGIWELVSRAGFVLEVFLPPPSKVFQELLSLSLSGELYPHLFHSLKRIFWGMLVGVGLGWIMGVIAGSFTILDATLNPIFACLYPVPKIAILPLLILYLGLGEASKVGVIAIGVFFPVYINTRAGVQNVDPILILAARSLGASSWTLWTKVLLPASMPYFLSGLRTSYGVALLLLVTSEMIGANSGIGYLILSSADLMLTNRLMAAILVISVLGLGLSSLIDLIERHFRFNKHPS